jgi:hypothetical protein
MDAVHFGSRFWHSRHLIIVAFISVLTFGFTTEKSFHAFHISKTDMAHNVKEKSLQITMHIFIDDLELALEKQGHKKLFIGTEREVVGVNDLITKYLQNNFSIKINDKQIPFAWIGKETAADKQAIWVYLEVKNVKSINQIFVENKILTETFSDQKNIVQVNIPSKKQGYFLLDKAKVSDMARF